MGKLWTGEVLRAVGMIGYDFPRNERDQGVPGRYFASHAEKQLMAYLISKHVFMREEAGREVKSTGRLTKLYDVLDIPIG
ncbi:hypothetical protein K469DRAFT_797690 [Zopfia rhizophila CBS 207.26]|uniref:Single-strand DNA deaminase toxin A-like C-terminal domain-containing protein n=1 Tax=Zopfia rhizophila CBS 207.26 TaxID=1314779 RepID=A0A6A6DN54_9PEZI|nr:hypothetical protein K469DRAFT_797690 [Zopfia rhizophila CBS 207.26]